MWMWRIFFLTTEHGQKYTYAPNDVLGMCVHETLFWIPMTFHLQLASTSGLRQAIYVACALVVISYILFDVLDLDGSNFPSVLAPVEKALIITELPSDVKSNHSFESVGPLGDVSVLSAGNSSGYSQLQRGGIQKFSPLDSARDHGYRVGLGRDSLADPPYG